MYGEWRASGRDPASLGLSPGWHGGRVDVATLRVRPLAVDGTWAEVAMALFAPGTVGATLQRIADLAGVAVEAADAAGVLVMEHGALVSAGSSHPLVAVVDALRPDTGQGPGLDLARTSAPVVSDDLSRETRWPAFARAATRAGVRSLMALPLSGGRTAALGLYAARPWAFDAVARARAETFATLAGIALGIAEDRTRSAALVANLHNALENRSAIGQAQGILMERGRITADDAFALLSEASQHLNRKLRDVAESLVETGELPGGTGPAGPPPSPR